MAARRPRLPKVACVAAALAFAAGPRPAAAERVLVRAASGEEGHAWLFGSAGECWLAVPRHVVDDPFSGRPQAFLFEDKSGRGGESEQPIDVSQVAGAEAAAGGVGDLAFARVASGRGKGECLSRLGLPAFAYDGVLSAGRDLTVFSLLPTSFGIFRTAVSRARSDPTGGGLVDLRPLDREDARTYLKRGLSGSTAEVARQDATYPFAMILDVPPGAQTARALRFDLVRKAFEIVEASDQGKRRAQRASSTEGLPYRILGFEGRTLEGAPSDLASGGCWQVMAKGGSRSVSVTIELGDPKDVVRGLVLEGAAGCAADGGAVTIAARIRPTEAWSGVTACSLPAAAGGMEPCRMELRGPRQLRITIEARRPVKLHRLRLQ